MIIPGIWHFCASLCCRLQAAIAHRTHTAPLGPLEPESYTSISEYLPKSLGHGLSEQAPEWIQPPAYSSLQQIWTGQQWETWSEVWSHSHLLCSISRAEQGQVPLGSGARIAGGVNEPGCAVCTALLEFCPETPWETLSMYYLCWLLEADANVSLQRSPKYPVLLWCVACVCSVYVSISHANKRLLSPFVLCSLIMRTLQPLSVVLPLQMLTVKLR